MICVGGQLSREVGETMEMVYILTNRCTATFSCLEVHLEVVLTKQGHQGILSFVQGAELLDKVLFKCCPRAKSPLVVDELVV